ncbi:Camk/camk1 protein kinase, partial [Globisporangium splendens]
MTFAKCIGGEPDRDFGSPMSHEMLPSRLKMRQLLGWTKGSNNRSEKTNNLEDLSLDDTKDDKPEQENDLENLAAKHGKPLSTPPSPELAPPPPPSVVYRKGEKSFLDFHQQYAITRHLGEGSYSTVKQVTHRKKGGFYACKIVDKASLSAVDRAALSQEVHVLSQISHNNIMRLHEVIEDDTKCYLVTELAEHGDLFDRIVKQGKFPQREAQKVVAALTEALYYCHSKNIIHRDIKPENVLLSGDNVKLCDFGFAKELSHSREQSVDSCGTPGYAAPEILDGKPYGIEVDVFSLGVVMYIMICGYPPFPMKLAQLRNHRFNVRFPSKDWAHVESSVKELLIKMLHITPSHRPSAAYLRAHPWIRKGKETLDQLRREAEERKRLADLTRKQQTADAIRKKLVMGGFEVVKYGRNGLPHRTKLRLSNDGKSITWQPKLFKRGLLRYQNARSITSLFGITKDNNGSSHPQLHVPQVNRLSSCEVVSGGKHSEPSLDDDGDADRRKSTLSSTGSNSSNNSSTSDSNSTNEKKLWWMSFRRDRGKAERTASGGFSLSFTTRSSASSFEGSSISSPPDRAFSAAVPVTPLPDKLDDSVHLSDIRAMLMGDQSEFFTAHKFNLPYGCKRAVDPGCVLSVATRFRELHLEFQNEEIRDGFAYLLEQVTLPLQKTVAEEKSRYANVSRVSSSEKDDEMDETTEFEDANQFAHECVQDGREHNNNNESE